MFSDSKCSLLAKNLCISPIVTCVDNLMNFFSSGYQEKEQNVHTSILNITLKSIYSAHLIQIIGEPLPW